MIERNGLVYKMKIYLDDLREPYDDSWTIAKTIEEFQQLVLSGEAITQMSFDHDLGENVPTGMDATKWFVELCLDEPSYGENLEIVLVHSANPPGAENILSYFMSAKAHGVFSSDLKVRRI